MRAPRDADASLIFDAYASDPETTRYLVWRPHHSVGETEAFMSRCIRAWQDGSTRPYVIVNLDNERVPIGMLEARIAPHSVDIGYVLQRAWQRTSRMSEAIAAVSNAALAHRDCFRVQATCDTENLASARTLEKCGFVREGRLERHAVLPNIGAEPRAALMYARCR